MSSLRRIILLVTILIFSLISCNNSSQKGVITPTPDEATEETSTVNILGQVDIPLSSQEGQSLTKTIESTFTNQGLVDTSKLSLAIPSATAFTVTEDDGKKYRYLSATVRVTNNTGQPLPNLTFRAVVSSNSIGGTGITKVFNTLGEKIDVPEIAQGVRFTHRVIDGVDGELVVYPPTADYQAFTLGERYLLQRELDKAKIDVKALQEGFVARQRNSRTIPDGEQGTVTISIRFPYSNNDASTTPFSFNLSFIVTTEEITRFTRGEFHDSTNQLEARLKEFFNDGNIPDTTELMFIGSDTETLSKGKTIRVDELTTFIVPDPSEIERYSSTVGEIVTIPLSDGRFFSYELIDGLAIYNGDIILGNPKKVEEMIKRITTSGMIASYSERRWPNGIIPYEIDKSEYSDEELLHLRTRLAETINYYHSRTNIRIVERTNQEYYVRIAKPSKDVCGSSALGLDPDTSTTIDGEITEYNYQTLFLTPNPDTRCALHEFGHMIGMAHEHTRKDRNNYIVIADKKYLSLRGKEQIIDPTKDFEDYGQYDYDSIMHYGTVAFMDEKALFTEKQLKTFKDWDDFYTALEGHRSIKMLSEQASTNTYLQSDFRLGQGRGLSYLDIQSVCLGLYPNIKPKIRWVFPINGANLNHDAQIMIQANIIDQVGNLIDFSPSDYVYFDEAEFNLGNPATLTRSFDKSVSWILTGDNGYNKSGQYVNGEEMTMGILPPGSYTLTIKTDTKCVDNEDSISFTVSNAPNNPPVARLSANPINGTAPFDVIFNISGTDDHNKIMEYMLDFGDGNSKTVAPGQERHTYQNHGTFIAKLTVKDDIGQISTDTVQISVQKAEQPNNPPVARLSANPTNGTVPFDVIFNISGTDDHNKIMEYMLDFGDGNSKTVAPGQERHTYQNHGTFIAKLTVKDDIGQIGTDTVQISVQKAEQPNNPPVARLSANPTNGTAPLTVNFDASGSYDTDGSITQYVVDFGDGTSIQTFSNSSFSYMYNRVGTYIVKMNVIDDDRATAANHATLSITVTENKPNQSPVARLSANPTSGTAPLTVRFDASGSYDTDGSIREYAVDFGDGTSLAKLTNSQFTHVFRNPGSYRVQMAVIDNENASSNIVTVTITVETSEPKLVLTRDLTHSPSPLQNGSFAGAGAYIKNIGGGDFNGCLAFLFITDNNYILSRDSRSTCGITIPAGGTYTFAEGKTTLTTPRGTSYTLIVTQGQGSRYNVISSGDYSMITGETSSIQHIIRGTVQ